MDNQGLQERIEILTNEAWGLLEKPRGSLFAEEDSKLLFDKGYLELYGAIVVYNVRNGLLNGGISEDFPLKEIVDSLDAYIPQEDIYALLTYYFTALYIIAPDHIKIEIKEGLEQEAQQGVPYADRILSQL